MFSQSIKLSGIASFVGNLVCFLLVASPTSSQIIPDNTLGNESSVVVPNQNIRGINSDRIDGGAVRGGNLFHSFQEFNVDVGRGVYFSNPDSIVNILTRVSGDNISNILGTLGVLGNANLFLINPNGIVFGPNARLDVGGSFFASTADGILFENGVEFAASNPEAPPLLTINIPLGLNIRENPGTIRVEGTGHNLSNDSETGEIIRENRPLGLQVPNGQTLALVGGDLLIEGGNLTVEEGRVELGSVRGNSQVNLNSTNLGWMLNYDTVPEFSDIQLSLAASIDVRGEQGGTIQIQGRQIKLTEASRIETRTLGVGGQAELTVKASESVEVTDVNANQIPSSLISIAEGVGQGGNTTIQTPQFIIRNGAEVGTATLSVGNAGNVRIETGRLTVRDRADIVAQTLGEGNAGNIEIETEQLIVRDGASLGTATLGEGNAGDITILASDSVELSASNGEDTGLVAGTLGGTGNAGNISIETEQLIVRDGALVATITAGEGDAGNITIIASDSVELSALNSEDTGLVAGTLGGEGDAGNVRIETGRLTVRDGALVATITAGEGNAGNITIIASESVELSASDGKTTGLVAGTLAGEGDAGNVRIETGRLTVRDGGQIRTRTQGQGNAGDITVIASDSVELSGAFNSEDTGLEAGADPGTTGNAGNIRIETGRLTVRDGAGIVAQTQGQGNAGNVQIETGQLIVRNGALLGTATQGEGNAGNITIIASDSVELSASNGELTALVAGTGEGETGNAGNVQIETGRLTVRDGAIVTTVTQGQGNAGNITITASDSVELSASNGEDTGLVAGTLAGEGDAGNVRIETGRLIVRDGGLVGTVTQGEGNAGNITIIASESVELSASNGEATALVAGTLAGEGDAGNVRIETGRLIVRDGGRIRTRTQGQGNAGDITIIASDSVELSGAFNSEDTGLEAGADPGTTGNAGNIRIETGQLIVRDGAVVAAQTQGQGNAGDITIIASDSVELSPSNGEVTGLVAGTLAGEGDAGNVRIETGRLIVRDGGRIRTRTQGQGNAGDITIIASDSVELSGAFNSEDTGLEAGADPGTTGNAGNIRIETGQLIVRGRALLGTATQGQGNAGDITIIASDSVELSALNGETTGLVAGVAQGGEGDAGNIRIETGRLIVRDGGRIRTRTQGQGDAGDITVIASDSVELSGAFNSEDTVLAAGADPGTTGNAGNIRIETGQLIVRGRAGIVAQTQGQGNAGNVEIETGQLIVRDGALLGTATQGEGKAGDITIIASDSVELSASNGETTALVAGTLGGEGDAGNVRIETGRLIVRDGGRVVTRTRGEGNAGDITIIASDSVEVEGVSPDGNASGLFANTSIDTDTNNNVSEDFNLIGGDAGNINIETTNLTIRNGGEIVTSSISSRGNAGTINIETQNLEIRDGSEITASSIFSQGNGGDINVIATESVELSNELNRPVNGLNTLSFWGTGNAGAINIRTQQLIMGKNTSIFAGTVFSFENSQAGNITITADTVELHGGRINAATIAAGNAGNITIETGELRLEDRATITVESESLESQDFSEFEIQQFTNSDAALSVQLLSSLFSSRSEQPVGEPGNINIQASEVLLNNQASLNAASENGNGGNITIASPDIFLRRQSEIVATGNASGETLEGNISIAANLLILLENSRIITDASNPTGGSNITIRPLGGSELAVLQSQNTTIRAAGDLSIDDTLNFDPPESPEVTVVDPAALIAQDPCKLRGDSEFIITGRGGIASSPNDSFTGDRPQVSLVEPVEPVRSSQNRSTSTQRPRTEPNQPRSSADIIPARGWIRDENGDVILVSYDPTKTGVRRQPQQYPNQCHPDE